jgi:hypothetical protein
MRLVKPEVLEMEKRAQRTFGTGAGARGTWYFYNIIKLYIKYNVFIFDLTAAVHAILFLNHGSAAAAAACLPVES